MLIKCYWWIPLTRGQSCGAWIFLCFFSSNLLKQQSSYRWFEMTCRSCDIIAIGYLGHRHVINAVRSRHQMRFLANTCNKTEYVNMIENHVIDMKRFSKRSSSYCSDSCWIIICKSQVKSPINCGWALITQDTRCVSSLSNTIIARWQ